MKKDLASARVFNKMLAHSMFTYCLYLSCSPIIFAYHLYASQQSLFITIPRKGLFIALRYVLQASIKTGKPAQHN